MISLLISILVKFVVDTISAMGYPGVFFLMFIESCGIPAPSEAIMPFAGFLVSRGEMNFILIVILGTLGNVLGSLLAYYIGKKGGRVLVEKYGKYIFLSRHDLDRADSWFAKRGELTVFIGRLLPVVRTYISFPAGIARMKLGRFTLFTTLGVLPWTILFGWLGVYLGQNWELIREKLHGFDMIILGLVVALIAGWFLNKIIKKYKRKNQTL